MPRPPKRHPNKPAPGYGPRQQMTVIHLGADRDHFTKEEVCAMIAHYRDLVSKESEEITRAYIKEILSALKKV